MFSRLASYCAHVIGRPGTFLAATLTVIVWAVTGPMFAYSDTWQLVINTGTTVVTFLIVFLIQNSQNRDGAAIQAKLDELIKVTEQARNELIGAETRPEAEINQLRIKE
jgi:low affinity Fe/Cu permease